MRDTTARVALGLLPFLATYFWFLGYLAGKNAVYKEHADEAEYRQQLVEKIVTAAESLNANLDAAGKEIWRIVQEDSVTGGKRKGENLK